MKPIRFAWLLLTAPLSGCGLIMSSPHQTVVVISDPASAEVRIRPQALPYWTPADIALARKRSYLLTLDLPGYRRDSVRVRRHLRPLVMAADILFTGGLGVLVDAVTGSWYRLTPELTSLVLEPDSVPVRVGITPSREGQSPRALVVVVRTDGAGEPAARERSSGTSAKVTNRSRD